MCCDSFRLHCVEGITPNVERMAVQPPQLSDAGHLPDARRSATRRRPSAPRRPWRDGTTLKEAVLALGLSDGGGIRRDRPAGENGIITHPARRRERKVRSRRPPFFRYAWSNAYMRQNIHFPYRDSQQTGKERPRQAGTPALFCQNMQKRRREKENVVQVST